MNLLAVLAKTAKGVEEIETRKYKLDQRARALLIVVNGRTSVAELQKKFEQMGDITPKLDQLVAGGFIAEAAAPASAPARGQDPSAEFKAVRAQIARAMLDAIGPAGDAITEKLEACGSAQELKNYLDTRRGVLEAALGRRGIPFWAKVKELLG